MSLSLRSYRKGDLPALYALDVLCFAEPFRFSRAALKRFAEDPRAIVRLAVENGSEQLLGFCILHLERTRSECLAYVLTLDVAPERRGAGVATALMQAVETQAETAGALSVSLHVYTENAGAVRLYQWLGYAQTGSVDDFYGPGLPARVYRKRLIPESTVAS